MRTRFVSTSLAISLAVGLIAGCDAGPKKKKSGKPPIVANETIGQTTDVVLKLSDALADGGTLAATNIEVDDPISQSTAAYRTSVGKLGAMAVDRAIGIRNASSIQDPKPLTHEELVTEIVKKKGQPDAIPLAKLPYYQEYAWDEAGQKLVVVEFAKRKEQYKEQMDEKLGRR